IGPGAVALGEGPEAGVVSDFRSVRDEIFDLVLIVPRQLSGQLEHNAALEAGDCEIVDEAALTAGGELLREIWRGDGLANGGVRVETGQAGEVDVGLVPHQPARRRIGAGIEDLLGQESREKGEGRERRSAEAVDEAAE